MHRELDYTDEELAYQLYVSSTAVYNWIRLWGEGKLKETTRQREGILTPEIIGGLLDEIDHNPTIFLEEMQVFIKEKYAIHASLSTICRALNTNGYTKKKISHIARKADSHNANSMIIEADKEIIRVGKRRVRREAVESSIECGIPICKMCQFLSVKLQKSIIRLGVPTKMIKSTCYRDSKDEIHQSLLKARRLALRPTYSVILDKTVTRGKSVLSTILAIGYINVGIKDS
ncbi:hypothetical protein ADUPG1_013237 [Aduncisulcus paluster]|uniref:Transposase n=1 Tax=Aduncisulcus paluster TaxID=2918883 RepID=A0ABQ5K410_9EUKA|nr:hypothetical protein ADUPG1_013237 [Aduncisulcus paluster]